MGVLFVDLLDSPKTEFRSTVRLVEGSTEHWPTPSKSLEEDLAEKTYRRYRLCTADIDPGGLFQAYQAE